MFAVPVPSSSDATAFPAVLLAVLGFGPWVMPALKLNVPAARASQTLTRIMRASRPVLIVCFDEVRVRLNIAG